MLKCGQKDNKNYTFGIRKDQRVSFESVDTISHDVENKYCASCGSSLSKNSNYCPNCGGKI